LQGEREMAAANKSLARFDLAGIPPAQRGMPQIEVEFDIDANGILHVKATDKVTGKEQKIEIKASSGLSDDEIDKMVQDAEAHKEEDRKFHELVSARNAADALVHSSRNSLKELGEGLSEDEKKAIEDAAKAVEEAMAGDDKDTIEARTNELQQAVQVLAQKAAEKAQAENAGGEAATDSAAADDDVVDAEFEEVKDQDNQ